jgi:beta-lactamase superfamily II metal-dependent hydrolase
MKRSLALLNWLIAATVVSLGLSGTPAVAQANEVRIEFLNVGQGDAVLIRSPEGKVALVDAGPSSAILDILKDRDVDHIDLVVASHHHADHIGGMTSVIKEYKPKVFLDSGSSHTTATYKRVLEAAQQAHSQYIRPNKDSERKITLGSVILRVFAQPPQDEDEDEENNNSIGIRVESEGLSVLLTGDSEEHERAWWMEHANGSLFRNVDVLKLAHHGSHNGTDKEWMQATKPTLAVVSCGADNPYGHPHNVVLRLLKRERVPLKRTDVDDTVVITSGSGRWRVVEEHKATVASPGGPEAESREPITIR